MEKNKESNFVENQTKPNLISRLTQNIQERDVKTSQKLKSEGNWDLDSWLCGFGIYKGGETKMDLHFKKQDSRPMYLIAHTNYN